jgi:predicted PurR-regulated permease PerM
MTPAPRSALREIAGVVWTWIKGQILIWLSTTALYLVGFAIARTPLWFLLAILCGLANAIPHFGAVFGLLFVLLFSFFGSNVDTWTMAAALAVWTVVQLAEGFYIGPKLLGRKLGLNPWLVILGSIAGGLVAGPIGMLIATPVLAVITVIWRRVRSPIKYGGRL